MGRPDLNGVAVTVGRLHLAGGMEGRSARVREIARDCTRLHLAGLHGGEVVAASGTGLLRHDYLSHS